jgi:hypothetical protein
MRRKLLGLLLFGCVVGWGCVGDSPVSTPDGSVDSSGPEATSDVVIPTSDGGDAGSWTPAVLDQSDQLALWLEPSASNFVIVTSAVGTWKDLSKNHNDAMCGSGCPSIDTAAINGHDAVRFDQKAMVLDVADSPSLQFGIDDIYVAAVASSAGQDGHGVFFTKSIFGACNGFCPYIQGLEFWLNGNQVDAGGTGLSLSTRLDPSNQADWTDPVFDDGKFHRVAMRRAGNGFSLYQSVDDAVPRAYSTGQKDLSNEAGASIGGWEPSLGVLPTVHLDLAELIIVHAKGALVADQTVLDVQKYLKAKYGI